MERTVMKDLFKRRSRWYDLLKSISNYDSVDIKTVQGSLGWKTSSFYKYWFDLIKAGFIEQKEEKRYRITSVGKEILNERTHVTTRPKYNNSRVVEDGITFDSKAEYKRYKELKLLQATGEVIEIEVHPTYLLQHGYRKCPKCKNVQQHISGSRLKRDHICRICGEDKIPLFKEITYTADFRVVYQDGTEEIEDVKGSKKMMTEAFLLKKKLFEWAYKDKTLKIVVMR